MLTNNMSKCTVCSHYKTNLPNTTESVCLRCVKGGLCAGASECKMCCNYTLGHKMWQTFKHGNNVHSYRDWSLQRKYRDIYMADKTTTHQFNCCRCGCDVFETPMQYLLNWYLCVDCSFHKRFHLEHGVMNFVLPPNQSVSNETIVKLFHNQ